MHWAKFDKKKKILLEVTLAKLKLMTICTDSHLQNQAASLFYKRKFVASEKLLNFSQHCNSIDKPGFSTLH